MPDPEINLSGDSEALIAYLLLKVHLDDVSGEDLKSLLDLYHQCLQVVKGQQPQGGAEEKHGKTHEERQEHK